MKESVPNWINVTLNWHGWVHILLSVYTQDEISSDEDVPDCESIEPLLESGSVKASVPYWIHFLLLTDTVEFTFFSLFHTQDETSSDEDVPDCESIEPLLESGSVKASVPYWIHFLLLTDMVEVTFFSLFIRRMRYHQKRMSLTVSP